MKEQRFEYNFVMYPVATLGLLTGYILGTKFDVSFWVPYIIYFFAGLMAVVGLLRHRTIVITENEIQIKELLRGERIVLKSEVVYYKTTYHYRKTPYTTWYFTMKSGKEIVLSHDYMQNEKSLTEAVNVWCSDLHFEASA